MRMLTYRVATGSAPSRDARRKLFAFAKAMGVDTLVLPGDADLAGLDVLADESAVKVAVLAEAPRNIRPA